MVQIGERNEVAGSVPKLLDVHHTANLYKESYRRDRRQLWIKAVFWSLGIRSAAPVQQTIAVYPRIVRNRRSHKSAVEQPPAERAGQSQ